MPVYTRVGGFCPTKSVPIMASGKINSRKTSSSMARPEPVASDTNARRVSAPSRRPKARSSTAVARPKLEMYQASAVWEDLVYNLARPLKTLRLEISTDPHRR